MPIAGGYGKAEVETLVAVHAAIADVHHTEYTDVEAQAVANAQIAIHDADVTDSHGRSAGVLPLGQIPDTLTGKDADTVDGKSAADLTPAEATVGDFLMGADASQDGTSSTTYIKLKEVTLADRGGDYRIKFDMALSAPSGTGYAKIYRNDVAVGTEQTTTVTSFTTKSEDIVGWSKGDKIQIYGKHSAGGVNVLVKNFNIYTGVPRL